MKKLKTSKDLISPKMKFEFINKKKCASRIELKKEAIKWIKYFNNKSEKIALSNEFPPTDSRYEKYDLGERDAKLIIFFIKLFFNINKEDL